MVLKWSGSSRGCASKLRDPIHWVGLDPHPVLVCPVLFCVVMGSQVGILLQAVAGPVLETHYDDVDFIGTPSST